MPNTLKGFAVAVSIFSFFCLMSRIDFIVNNILYGYGLQFSYVWANEYWTTYTCTFIAFSLAIGLVFWLSSGKTIRDLEISIGLIATVNLLMIGGLADIMFYIFWSGGLPPNGVNWWWISWSHVFGIWTSSMQIHLFIMVLSIVLVLWTRIIRLPTEP